MAVIIQSEQKNVVISRSFEGLIAQETNKILTLRYHEQTSIDNEVIKDEIKEYSRDFDFWKASQLGQAILQMVDMDLAQQDPSAPRSTPTE